MTRAEEASHSVKYGLTMNTITTYLTNDHKLCDELFANAQSAVETKNWALAKTKFDKFLVAMNWHINIEENLLFPKFEEATGMQGGPTQVMRLEHIEIRKTLDDMLSAITNQRKSDFISACNDFLAALQPHSTKEEQILYPICDEQMLEQVSEILNKMEQSR